MVMYNKKPKILCMTDLSLVPEAMNMLKKNADVDYFPANYNHLLEIVHQYDAFWGHVNLKVDKEVLKRAKRLRVINASATGTNHIDKVEAEKRGIRVLSITKDFGLLDTFTATAECAWMLILTCMRNFRGATRSVCKGNWNSESFRGTQLSKLTLGVLGVGRLGKMTVEYGKAFRMKVLGCDLKKFNIPSVEQVDFNTLLQESDVISIHIHMTPENYHIFNNNTFARMKDNSVLVNTSRGDIIDEISLIKMLNLGKLSAFGADVIHNEWRKNMLISPIVKYAQEHDNVVITPHIGGCTYRSIVDARIFSAKKLVYYLETGEELRMP